MTSGREDSPLLGFSTLTPLPVPNVGELPPITASTFTTRSPDNTQLSNHASTSANPDLVISPAFIEANYEREMELRPARVRIATPVLRTRSPRVQRHKGRVVDFEEAPNKDGSRVEREPDGRSTSKRRTKEGGSRGGNLSPLIAAHLGISENEQPS
ncbi:hypothetical protein Tco_0529550 [Tanacetum coccineum]